MHGSKSNPRKTRDCTKAGPFPEIGLLRWIQAGLVAAKPLYPVHLIASGERSIYAAWIRFERNGGTLDKEITK
jgi:hypothetical protein